MPPTRLPHSQVVRSPEPRRCTRRAGEAPIQQGSDALGLYLRAIRDSRLLGQRNVIELRFGLTATRALTRSETGRALALAPQLERLALRKLEAPPQTQALRDAA
jgi:hypothetical protein